MKYCTKCGNSLVDTAKFCNYCGAPTVTPAANPSVQAEQEATQNPYADVTPVHQQPQYNQYQYTQPKNEEELQAEEQNLLNRLYIGLKHEALAWRIGAIVFMVYAVLMIVVGILGMENSVEGITDFLSGILYIPISIIGFVMAGKVKNCRDTLYTDCTAAIRHYTPGSIVMGALFNSIAMIFVIIYFSKVKSNIAVVERIKSKQNAYNSQQY